MEEAMSAKGKLKPKQTIDLSMVDFRLWAERVFHTSPKNRRAKRGKG
jgi:hypothetical protein